MNQIIKFFSTVCLFALAMFANAETLIPLLPGEALPGDLDDKDRPRVPQKIENYIYYNNGEIIIAGNICNYKDEAVHIIVTSSQGNILSEITTNISTAASGIYIGNSDSFIVKIIISDSIYFGFLNNSNNQSL